MNVPPPQPSTARPAVLQPGAVPDVSPLSRFLIHSVDHQAPGTRGRSSSTCFWVTGCTLQPWSGQRGVCSPFLPSTELAHQTQLNAGPGRLQCEAQGQEGRPWPVVPPSGHSPARSPSDLHPVLGLWAAQGSLLWKVHIQEQRRALGRWLCRPARSVGKACFLHGHVTWTVTQQPMLAKALPWVNALSVSGFRDAQWFGFVVLF